MPGPIQTTSDSRDSPVTWAVSVCIGNETGLEEFARDPLGILT